ncbi:hypothetical protein PRIPAC_85639 [Pristionchus pacificus]|uniref:B3_4 domain-containing protein n=1 Tax=Pristionchus pacificus TaxID=54126 RepID=A0A2A6BLR9_PRIPA|nr:hypothetical protein PRIPAC_85639 [Pristionchus pacificus]|eukprot:PDM66756.1 hypothetical protein PRIPAC_48173 [Pristionchus pacificus]
MDVRTEPSWTPRRTPLHEESDDYGKEEGKTDGQPNDRDRCSSSDPAEIFSLQQLQQQMTYDSDSEQQRFYDEIMQYVPGPMRNERDEWVMERNDFDPGYEMTVQIEHDLAEIRPFYVSLVLRNVDLTGDKCRKFINLQTKIHAKEGKDRRLAAVATHDLEKVALPVRYCRRDTRSHEMTALKEKTPVNLHTLLWEEDPTEMKRMAVDRYRHHLSGVDSVPVTEAADGSIITLHPITNCEQTRISSSTTSILVEVTSSVSVDACYRVVDVLVERTFLISPEMKVEQMKVVDNEGNCQHEFTYDLLN